MPRSLPHPSGFTLLETLVAFLIAAGAAIAVFQAVSSGLRETAIAAHTTQAWQRARSRLDAQSISLQPGDTTGDDGGGFDYRVSIRQRQDADMPGTPNHLRLVTVAVTIAWRLDGAQRRVELVSDRLAVVP